MIILIATLFLDGLKIDTRETCNITRHVQMQLQMGFKTWYGYLTAWGLVDSFSWPRPIHIFLPFISFNASVHVSGLLKAQILPYTVTIIHNNSETCIEISSRYMGRKNGKEDSDRLGLLFFGYKILFQKIV